MLRPALILASLALVAAPSAARAAPAWLEPTPPLSAPGADASRADLAVDADGDVLIVWTRSDTLEAVSRPAGGAFGEPVPIASGGLPTAASVAFDPQGNAILVFGQTEGAIRRTYAAFRPDGGTFGAPQAISAPGVFTDNPSVYVDRFGNALAVWQENGLGTAFRPAGGTFGEPKTLGVSGTGNNGFDAAFDQDGNALVVTARLTPGSGSVSYIESAYRPAGGAFGDMQPVADALDGAGAPAVAFDGAGNAIAVYLLWDTTVVDPQLSRYRVATAARPAGGPFGPSEPLSTTMRSAWVPDIAFDPAGNAVATWMQGFHPQAAIRPPGGPFGPAQRLSPMAHDTLNGPAVAIDAQGTTHVVWVGTDGSGYAARYVSRPPGGSFSEMKTLSAVDVHANDRAQLELDPAGNLAALWRRSDGTNYRYQLAAYDGAPPQLRNLALPPAGLAGAAFPFGVTPVDVWSPVTSTSWDFGDGTSAHGTAVSHTFGSPGTFAATVSAVDALGNAAAAGGNVTVGAAPTDRDAPELSALRVDPTRFRAAGSGPMIAATRIGATVSYSLSEPARVRIRVERATVGRRVGGACRRTTPANRRRARCRRYVALKGSAARAGQAGANSLKFRGRMRGRALRPHRYRLALRATDAAGNRSAVRRARFRIVAR